MKKKFLSILLALAMVVSLLPAKVQAKETEPNYFCITNTSDEVATVTWTCKGSPYDTVLCYKIGAEGNWTNPRVESGYYLDAGLEISVPANTSVYFKAEDDYCEGFSKFYIIMETSQPNEYYSISCDKPHTASGDITTLLRESGNVTDLTVLGEDGNYDYVFAGLFAGDTNLTSAENLILPSEKLTPVCYSGMFYRCTSLVKGPKLPASDLANGCYRYMFVECTSLETAPSLPATTLAEYCYVNMFSKCTNLETAPSLPATTLAEKCYAGMFGKCTNLETAPSLPATTLADSCYYQMFAGCTSLNSIKMLATDISADYCLEGWVSNVASNGTFTKSAQMTTLTTGDGVIPEGWTVQNSDGSAVAVPEYTICFSYDDGKGEVSADKDNAAQGETVTLSVTPAEGYKLKSLNVKAGEDNIEVANNTFTMPTADVTVAAEFEEITSGSDYYSVSIADNTENGTVIADKVTATPGETVTLTVTPAEGYKLKSLNVKAGEDNIEVANNTFTMPAADVIVTAEFKEIYSIYMSGDTENGTIIADKVTAAPGEEVTLTVSPNKGYKLKSLTVKAGTDDIEVPNYTFTMPAADVTVTAEFEEIVVIYYSISITGDIENGTVTADKATAAPGEKVTLTVTLNEGYSVKSLTAKAGETPITINYVHDGEYKFTMPDGDVNVEFVFGILFNIRFSYNDGKGTASSNVGSACPGDIITLTATPNPGCEFIRWESDDVEIENGCFTMPNHHVHIKAVFSGPGTIYVDTNELGTASADKTIAEEGEVVTLSVTPNPGYEFLYWQSDVEIEEGRFTMPDHSVYITAVFGVTYTVTVTAGENGTTSVDKIKAYEDKRVFLSAQPNSGYRLVGWESDDVTVEGNTFAMPAKNVSVKAIFEPVTLVPSVAYRYPVTDGTNVVFNDDGTVKFADGNRESCIVVDGKAILWTEGWYVVNGKVDIDERITVSGNVNLILSDGCELNANSGITVSGEENSLTIYGQSAGTGTLNAVNIGMNGAAGIGGEEGCNGNNITINGGVIVAGYPSGENAKDAAGIGGGSCSDGINITINGGNVLAYGSISSAGIGGATEGDGKDITINGGTVYAKGSAGHGAAGIGSGGDGEGSDISINGGKVTAVGRIGIGGDLGSENIVIKNSIVKAGADAANATTISADVVTENELNNAAYVIIEPNPAKNNGSQGTGSSTDVPGSGSQGTGSSTDVPESGSQGTGSSTDVPESGSQGTGSSTDVPESGSQGTGSSTDVPESGSQGTGSSTDVPGSGSQGTGSSTDVPESGSQGTGSSTDVPGSGSQGTGSSTDVPESGSQGTGSSTDVPGSGSQGTGSSTDVPGSGSQGTGSSTDVPESGSQGTVNTEDPEAGNTESGKDEGSENAAPVAETLPEEEINEIVEGAKNLTADTFKGVKAYTAAAENSINEPEKITHRDGGYYDKNGEKVTDTFISTKKGVKFVGADGKTVRRSLVNVVDPVTGKVTKYYATKNGTIAKNRLITLTDGTRIFTKEDGSVAANGIVTNPATGRQYYADENGAILRNSVVVVDGKKYYTNKYGVIKKNALVTDADGVRHFCGPDGAFVKNEWVLVGKKEYWCNKKGNITKDRDVK